MTAPAPIIVTALLDPDGFAWLDGLRRAHFPAERNVLEAHLTLFHALPPSLEPELKRRLSSLTRGPSLAAEASGFVSLGRGVAVRIVSPQLTAVREELAEAFRGMLTPQDAAGWRPHVTIQNKVRSPRPATFSRYCRAASGTGASTSWGWRRGGIGAALGSRWRDLRFDEGLKRPRRNSRAVGGAGPPERSGKLYRAFKDAGAPYGGEIASLHADQRPDPAPRSDRRTAQM
jgi:2'-5' RNA ligase